MTFRSGNCESELIRLSVRPSLRYSLPGSAVALTKGSTAIEEIFLLPDAPRRKYAVAVAATNNTAATPAIKYLRLRTGAVAGVETAPSATTALDERPESRSRFSRARS